MWLNELVTVTLFSIELQWIRCNGEVGRLIQILLPFGVGWILNSQWCILLLKLSRCVCVCLSVCVPADCFNRISECSITVYQSHRAQPIFEQVCPWLHHCLQLQLNVLWNSICKGHVHLVSEVLHSYTMASNWKEWLMYKAFMMRFIT